jgi:hypothetical protein
MQAARQSGFLGEKDGRIASRVSEALVKQAKRLTGIQSDTDLIEFALATIALEDHFAEAFKEARGKVDPDLTLGFLIWPSSISMQRDVGRGSIRRGRWRDEATSSFPSSMQAGSPARGFC